ncbi:hypothetical protein [Umezakia ovalisporum]|uniref:hypothetical protein n=1 Tax=Umezakia ovalisporum TaxID=75695 RepID=UPI0035BB04EF
MEVGQRIPPKMNSTIVDAELEKIPQVIARLIIKAENKSNPNKVNLHKKPCYLGIKLLPTHL